MIYIEIIQNSGGRTGHKLKDYLTAFCFYYLCNYKTIINKYWNFPKNNCNNHLDMFNLNASDIFIDRPNEPIVTIEYSLANWNGINYDKFKDYFTKFYYFFFELPLDNMVREFIKFKY